jgi:hypothetical protein
MRSGEHLTDSGKDIIKSLAPLFSSLEGRRAPQANMNKNRKI